MSPESFAGNASLKLVSQTAIHEKDKTKEKWIRLPYLGKRVSPSAERSSQMTYTYRKLTKAMLWYI